MRFLFIVQGEGRGHMTQAISLYHILSRQSNEVCAVMVGRSRSREIPEFFVNRIGAPVSTFSSPNFRLDSKRIGVNVFGTFFENLARLQAFARSLLTIRRAVHHHRPDIIVNLYEPLTAIYVALWCPKSVGAGLCGFDLDLARFLKYIPGHRGKPKSFREWVHSAEWVYTDLLNHCGGGLLHQQASGGGTLCR